jgi:hypothetical protein
MEPLATEDTRRKKKMKKQIGCKAAKPRGYLDASSCCVNATLARNMHLDSAVPSNRCAALRYNDPWHFAVLHPYEP